MVVMLITMNIISGVQTVNANEPEERFEWSAVNTFPNGLPIRNKYNFTQFMYVNDLGQYRLIEVKNVSQTTIYTDNAGKVFLNAAGTAMHSSGNSSNYALYDRYTWNGTAWVQDVSNQFIDNAALSVNPNNYIGSTIDIYMSSTSREPFFRANMNVTNRLEGYVNPYGEMVQSATTNIYYMTRLNPADESGPGQEISVIIPRNKTTGKNEAYIEIVDGVWTLKEISGKTSPRIAAAYVVNLSNGKPSTIINYGNNITLGKVQTIEAGTAAIYQNAAQTGTPLFDNVPNVEITFPSTTKNYKTSGMETVWRTMIHRINVESEYEPGELSYMVEYRPKIQGQYKSMGYGKWTTLNDNGETSIKLWNYIPYKHREWALYVTAYDIDGMQVAQGIDYITLDATTSFLETDTGLGAVLDEAEITPEQGRNVFLLSPADEAEITTERMSVSFGINTTSRLLGVNRIEMDGKFASALTLMVVDNQKQILFQKVYEFGAATDIRESAIFTLPSRLNGTGYVILASEAKTEAFKDDYYSVEIGGSYYHITDVRSVLFNTPSWDPGLPTIGEVPGITNGNTLDEILLNGMNNLQTYLQSASLIMVWFGQIFSFIPPVFITLGAIAMSVSILLLILGRK